MGIVKALHYALEWSVDGRLVFDLPGDHGVRHLANVSHEQAIDLWCALGAAIWCA